MKPRSMALYARVAGQASGELESQFATIRRTIPARLRHLPQELYGDLCCGKSGAGADGESEARPGLAILVQHVREGWVHSIHLMSADALAGDPLSVLVLAVACAWRNVPVFVGGLEVARSCADLPPARWLALALAGWLSRLFRRSSPNV